MTGKKRSGRFRKSPAMAACALAALLALPGGAPLAEETVIGRFSAGDLAGWEPKRFAGETAYRLTREAGGGETVLEAISKGAASGLVLARKIDLTKTPILIWRWRIERPVNPPDELSREGDDFAVRVYFVVPGAGFFSWPDSVVYVWASRQPVGSSWPNPFTPKAHMIAVDSGAGRAGEWRAHRRNMREDFKAHFGRDVTEVTHIALMTDSDNSGLSARGWYGDVRIAPAASPDDKKTIP